jgi:hypothetical protein
MASSFPIVIFNARPAAGKSEIIRYLEGIPLAERKERFHIGSYRIFDDFRMLWTWFEEDDLLEREFNLPRLHSNSDHYFLEETYWHVLIRRLSIDYRKWRRDLDGEWTAIIEFSRGSEHGGYQAAYQHLSEEILESAACLYIEVSFQESLRKNRLRYNPDRPDSILQHALNDEKMHRIYRDDDWHSFTARDAEYLYVRNIRVPFTVFQNEDDVTTRGGNDLDVRLGESLDRLWNLWQKRHEGSWFKENLNKTTGV